MKRSYFLLLVLLGFSHVLHASMAKPDAQVSETVAGGSEVVESRDLEFTVVNVSGFHIKVRQVSLMPSDDGMYHIDYELSSRRKRAFVSNGTYVWIDVIRERGAELKSIHIKGSGYRLLHVSYNEEGSSVLVKNENGEIVGRRYIRPLIS